MLFSCNFNSRIIFSKMISVNNTVEYQEKKPNEAGYSPMRFFPFLMTLLPSGQIIVSIFVNQLIDFHSSWLFENEKVVWPIGSLHTLFAEY